MQEKTVIISDLHVGSPMCLSEALLRFLKILRHGNKVTRLILNGDVVDSSELHRLTGRHWDILDELRKLSKHIELVWVAGNHDRPVTVLAELLGVRPVEEYTFFTIHKHKVLCVHGDKFDTVINKQPRLVAVADFLYRILQRIDSSHTLARYAKYKSKIFLRNAYAVQTGAYALAQERNADIVCCGHTHMAVNSTKGPGFDTVYFNSGSWAEAEPTYLLFDELSHINGCLIHYPIVHYLAQ